MKIKLKLSLMKIMMPLLIASAIGCSTNSYAIEITVGSISCKEWLEDRGSESDYTNKYVDQSWIVGFLGGYSTATGIDFLTDVKTQAMYVWMDKYCASHPLKKVDDGSVILVHELIQKMEK